MVDPALKESAFLTNIFNRLARSCIYGAQNVCAGHLPAVEADADVLDACHEATLAYERCAHAFDAHGALAVAEDFCRNANRRWGDESRPQRATTRLRARAGKCLCRAAHGDAAHAPRGAGWMREDLPEHLGFAAEDFFSGACVRDPWRAGAGAWREPRRARAARAAAALRLLREAPEPEVKREKRGAAGAPLFLNETKGLSLCLIAGCCRGRSAWCPSTHAWHAGTSREARRP